jgi:hypothetical protein
MMGKSKPKIDAYSPWCGCCSVPRVSDSGTKARTPKKLRTGENAIWTINSGTLIQANHGVSGKLCDYLIRCDRPSKIDALVVELKSRVQGANDIIEQFQNGLDLLRDKNVPRVRAALVHSGSLKMNELRVLRTRKLLYRGKPVMLEFQRSGSSLENLLGP